MKRKGVWIGIGAALLAAGLAADARAFDGRKACTRTTASLFQCCEAEAWAGLSLETAKCRNLADRAERSACSADARAAYREAQAECREQRGARADVCEAIGDGPYDPDFDPMDMAQTIDNPFLPFEPGMRWVYEGETEDGLETVVVEVLDETREVDGVACRVVRDQAFLDGELIEDTLDWFVQDKDGNVRYCGELSYEIEDEVIVSLAGSWEAGVDGAKHGVVMQGEPRVGQVYRQEWAPKEAEDMAEVLATDASVTVPFGHFDGVLQTREFTPVEPDAEEHKFYAAGVGLVLEVNVESGDRVELVEFTP